METDEMIMLGVFGIIALLVFAVMTFDVLSFSESATCDVYDTVMTDGNFTVNLCRTGSMCDLSFENWSAVTPQTIDDLEVGDVILFKKLTASKGIAHRIVSIAGNYITTRGDCNSANDLPIPFENVVFKLVE